MPFAGWEMPVQYTGIVDEHQTVRAAVGAFDVSHMGELRLRGEYAAQVVDHLVTNDAKKLVDGQGEVYIRKRATTAAPSWTISSSIAAARPTGSSCATPRTA